MSQHTNTTATTTPKHVALIMDGNGRWAQSRMMPRAVGHAAGARQVKSLVQACAKHGVQYMTIFAFSTENWGRPQDEVTNLMSLFIKYLDKEIVSMSEQGVRLRVLGDLSKFPSELQQKIKTVQAQTAQNKSIILNVAANYGGRWDIVQAVKGWKLVNPATSIDLITESDLAKHLSTAEAPDVDLLIRTGGEFRISNFLLWQCAYAELYFSEVLWPDFTVVQLEQALHWFGARARRFGKI